MDEPTNIPKMRTFLVERREALRQLYARMRKYGDMMRSKGLVVWSAKGHGFAAEFISDRTYKERELIKKLFDLQRNVREQAMLLLELEHALDHEEQKRAKEEVPA